MLGLKRISKVFQSAEQIYIDDSSKIIMMSDCHRGDGSWADDFFKNQNLFFTALDYYYNKGYTYIEIGDGDELWENRSFSDIYEAHKDTFWNMSRFFNENRLYLIFGNHDMVKRDKKFVKNNLYQCYDERKKGYVPLFPNVKIHEGLVLNYKGTNNKIFLTHGHQVELLNNSLWRLSRFFVRYLWRPLELFGVNDPIRTAKNYKKKDRVARRLTEWVIREKHLLITGHNHRSMFPGVDEPAYFNDGSCVHHRCITGIEIVNGFIMLIKWCIKTKSDGTLFIDREILSGPRKLKDYFNKNSKYSEQNIEDSTHTSTTSVM
ncbi:metallophosphoesterase [Schnuerera sp. xch1]|uniref:metallophosphoesterase n=1 Tax=Schnuerera sp. xch1 TaxID=2874283 RepID=UPI001CC183EC|nr:metallophosphoesterase [Schnuerera sp. xch1]MBZ2174784.1 metallophosphoesterase [Schnuerera sp. xch1]